MTSFMDYPNQSISASLFFDHVVYEQALIPRASRAGGCILTFFLSDFLEGNKSIPPLLGTDQSLTRKKPLPAKKNTSHLIKSYVELDLIFIPLRPLKCNFQPTKFPPTCYRESLALAKPELLVKYNFGNLIAFDRSLFEIIRVSFN